MLKLAAVALGLLIIATPSYMPEPATSEEKLNCGTGPDRDFTTSGRSGPIPMAGLTSHEPIYIEGNENFSAANGVSGGTGTSQDPYIIQDLEIINAKGGCISILNTTANFIVQNLYCDGSQDGLSVYLRNVTNGTFVNCTVWDGSISLVSVVSNHLLFQSNRFFNSSGVGMQFWGDSSDIRIKNNTIESSGDGILFERGWSRVLIDSNTLLNCSISTGGASDNNTISNNIIRGSKYGHEALDVSLNNNTRVTGNVIEPGSWNIGIYALSGSNLTISNNTIDNCTYGIYHSIDYGTISGNLLNNNSYGVFGGGLQISTTRNIINNCKTSAIFAHFGVGGQKFDGNRISGSVVGIDMNDDYCSIKNNTVSGCTDAGIFFRGDMTNVSENSVFNNRIGISISDNRYREAIWSNDIFNNTVGVLVDRTFKVGVFQNRFHNNSAAGLEIKNCEQTMVYDCLFTNDGIKLSGDDLWYFKTQDLQNNTVNGKPLIYEVDRTGINQSAPAGQVIFVNCSDFSIQDSAISNTSIPLILAGSNNGTVRNCSLSGINTSLYVRNSSFAFDCSTLHSAVSPIDIYLDYSNTSAPSLINSTDSDINLSKVRFSIVRTPDVIQINRRIDIYVSDSASGGPVSGALVTSKNSFGRFTGHGTTSADGLLRGVPMHIKTLDQNGTRDYNPFIFSAAAPEYLDNRSGPLVNITGPLYYQIWMNDIGMPWSEIGPLPEIQTSRDLELPFQAGDNGSGLAFVELFYNNGSGWRRFSGVDGASGYLKSPINFTNLTDEGTYGFYTVAHDRAGNTQPEPYNTAYLLFDESVPVCDIDPPDNAIIYTGSPRIYISFSERMNVSSINISIQPGEWSLAWSEDNTTLTFEPRQALDLGTYVIRVSGGKDRGGHSLAPVESRFTISEPDTRPPIVVSVDPPMNASIPTGWTRINITFSEAMDHGTVERSLRFHGAAVEAGNWTDANYSIVVEVLLDELYIFTMDTTASDLAGNHIQFPFTWNYYPIAQSGSITGYVFLEDDFNRPAEGAMVECRGIQVVTDSAGRYNFSGLGPGYYQIRVSGVALYFDNLTGCTLLEGQHILLDIGLRAFPGTLIGTVKTDKGILLKGAKITIVSASNPDELHLQTGPNGSFSVPLRPGKYTISVSASGSKIRLNVTIKANETKDLGVLRLSESNPSGSLPWPFIFTGIGIFLVCGFVLYIIKGKRPGFRVRSARYK